eukprot:SAG31_NODE_2517_length_5576_cov_3.265839_4_plen_97_part_00
MHCCNIGTNHAGDVADPKGVADTACANNGLHRWPGFCFVLDPIGSTLAASDIANGNGENIVYANLDPNSLSRWRKGSGDMIKYRRPDTYSVLVARL